MHEFALVRSLLAKAEEAAAGRTIRRITVIRGVDGHISSDSLTFCFARAAEGGPVAEARLDIVDGPGDGLLLESLELDEPA